MLVPSVVLLRYFYAECHNKVHYAECRYADCACCHLAAENGSRSTLAQAKLAILNYNCQMGMWFLILNISICKCERCYPNANVGIKFVEI